MTKRVTITDLIQRLEALRTEHGDLDVWSVNYHSDFRDEPLTSEQIEEQVGVVQGERPELPYLLIYGGSH